MASNTQGYKLSTSNLILVMVLVSVLVLFVGIFLSKNLYAQIKLKHRIDTKESEAAAQLQANLTAAPLLIQNYKNLPITTQQELTDALPTSVAMPELVALLDNVANKSGVTLKSIGSSSSSAGGASSGGGTSVGAVDAGPYISSNGIVVGSTTTVVSTLSVEGSYANALKFLSDLELSARPVKLSNIQFQGSTSTISTQVQMTTYYQKAPSLQPKTETVK